MLHTFALWMSESDINEGEVAAIQELIDQKSEDLVKSIMWDWQNADVCPTDIVPRLYPPESRPALLIDEADQGLTRLCDALLIWTENKVLNETMNAIEAAESSSSIT